MRKKTGVVFRWLHRLFCRTSITRSILMIRQTPHRGLRHAVIPSCMKCRLMMRPKVTDPLSPPVSPSLVDSEIKDVLSVATALAKDENVSRETFICPTPEFGNCCEGKFALLYHAVLNHHWDIILTMWLRGKQPCADCICRRLFWQERQQCNVFMGMLRWAWQRAWESHRLTSMEVLIKRR